MRIEHVSEVVALTPFEVRANDDAAVRRRMREMANEPPGSMVANRSIRTVPGSGGRLVGISVDIIA